MRNLRSPLLVVLFAVAACAPGQSVVSVTVGATGTVSNVHHLRVTVDNASMTSKEALLDLPAGVTTIPPQQTFTITFGADRRGDYKLHVDAVNAAGTVLSSGEATGTLQPSSTNSVEVMLTGVVVTDGGTQDLAGQDSAVVPDLRVVDLFGADLVPPPPDLVPPPPDLTPPPDLFAADLVFVPDLVVVPDQTVLFDFVVVPDQVKVPDMVTVPDMTPGIADMCSTVCSGMCTDTSSNANHCGACGRGCNLTGVATAACTGGLCFPSCQGGFADCAHPVAPTADDGCEINITNDPNHCGGCPIVCSNNNMATRTCGGSTCNGTCASGFADCNGNKQTDGCETNTTNNPATCGGCTGFACSTNNVTAAVCAGGVCTSPCAPGFADCNGNKLSDGCERSVDSDVLNCGGCGVLCGGTCSLGRCITTLYVGGTPTGIATDGSFVYWPDNQFAPGGSINKVSANGGARTQLVTGLNTPRAIALSSGNMYWTLDAAGSVMMANVSGASVNTIATGQTSPQWIHADANSVFWATFTTSGTIMRANIGGGGVTMLASGQNQPIAVTSDASTVYWANFGGSGAILKIPRLGGTVTTLASGVPSPRGIATDGASVYYTTGTTVLKLPVGGGTPTTLASTGFVAPLVIDSTHAYFTTSNGDIQKAPLAGGPLVTLATGQNFAASLAVDATSLYIAINPGSGGSIVKLSPK